MEIKKYLSVKRILPVIIGAVLGFGYYKLIGCKSGSCPITGNPYISTLYGAAMGLLITIPSKKENKKIE